MTYENRYNDNAMIGVNILGSTGFIGKSIIESFSKDSMFNVSGFSSKDANLTNLQQTLSLLKYIPEGSILIIASAVTRDKGQLLSAMLDNIKMASNLASLIFQKSFSHVVYLSTVDVYGRNNLRLTLSESSKIQPDNYYAISKYTSELILKKACFDKNIYFTVLRLPGVYGPEDTHRSPIKIFITSVINGEQIRVVANGSQLRDFLYVNDVQRVIKAVILRKITGTFNVVTGESYTINEVLNLIENISNSSINIFYEENSMDKLDLVFNKSALLSQVPEFSFTELSDGLENTYKYYCQKNRCNDN